MPTMTPPEINPPFPFGYVPSPDIPYPDTSLLVTEDGAPAESIFVEKQRRLLTVPLYTSWTPSAGQTFRVFANVGLFNAYKEPPYVPDAMLALNVPPANDPHDPDHRSYFMWVVGKPPDVVIEVVSDTRGGEDARKLKHYASIGVPYYAIFDPELHLKAGVLRAYALTEGAYRTTDPTKLHGVGLGLKLWDGEYENERAVWLRWVDETGTVVLTGKELAELEKANARAERAKADAERAKADAERARADAEKARADEAVARLREWESRIEDAGST